MENKKCKKMNLNKNNTHEEKTMDEIYVFTLLPLPVICVMITIISGKLCYFYWVFFG